MNTSNIYRAAFFLGIAIVTLLSLLPQESLPQSGLSDKLEHLLAYAVLCVAGCWAFPDKIQRILIFLVLYGVVLELLQSLIPGRVPSMFDGLANTMGIALGWAFLRVLRRTLPSNS